MNTPQQLPPLNDPAAAPQKRKRGRPRIHPVKPKLSPEELSRIRSEAGRISGQKRALNKIPFANIRMWKADYEVIQRIARVKSMSAPQALHLVVEYFNENVAF